MRPLRRIHASWFVITSACWRPAIAHQLAKLPAPDGDLEDHFGAAAAEGDEPGTASPPLASGLARSAG